MIGFQKTGEQHPVPVFIGQFVAEFAHFLTSIGVPVTEQTRLIT